MTLRESLIMYDKLFRQIDFQNSIGSLALERFSATTVEIEESGIKEDKDNYYD